MKLSLIAAFAVLSFLVLVGCGGGGGNNEQLSAGSNLLVTKETQSYEFSLSGFNMDQPGPDWLVAHPQFEIYDGHAGDTGDTLQLISRTDGIHMTWSYGSLSYIRLFEGWKGQVIIVGQPTGLQLGSKGSDFVAQFPNCTVEDRANGFGGKSYRTSLVVQTTTLRTERLLWVYCDSSDVIKQFFVTRGY
jgi:hypothetical protein